MATKATKTKVVSKKTELKRAIKLQDMTVAELHIKEKDLRKQIAKATLEMAAGKAKNVRLGFTLRKQLAKTLSVLRMKHND